jgi:hypothetical protein
MQESSRVSQTCAESRQATNNNDTGRGLGAVVATATASQPHGRGSGKSQRFLLIITWECRMHVFATSTFNI